MAATKAAAARFFAAHAGQMLDTRQVDARTSREWIPGPRRVKINGRRVFLLRSDAPADWSEVVVTQQHRVVSVTDTTVTLEWWDPGTFGAVAPYDQPRLLNTTTYSL